MVTRVVDKCTGCAAADSYASPAVFKGLATVED